MIYLLIIIAIILFLFYVGFAILSFFEKEKKAAYRSIILAFIEPIPYLLLAFIPFPGRDAVVIIVLSLLLISIIVILLPLKGNFKLENEIPNFRFDERNTMFSRNEIAGNADK